MNRRTFLRATVATPIATSSVATAQQEDSLQEDLSDGYFSALPETKADGLV